MPMGLLGRPQYLNPHSARHVVNTVGKIMRTEGNVERQDRRGFCLFHGLILEKGKLSWSDNPGLHS